MREDCLEIYNILSHQTGGYSKELPWFNQVELYLSKSSDELDMFCSGFNYKGAAKKHMRDRIKFERGYAARYLRLCPEKAPYIKEATAIVEGKVFQCASQLCSI